MVNQTRMWFASHFSIRDGGDWNNYENYMFKHLVDGSRFANRLGWHWVMGSQTGKVYGFSKFQVQNMHKHIYFSVKFPITIFSRVTLPVSASTSTSAIWQPLGKFPGPD